MILSLRTRMFVVAAAAVAAVLTVVGAALWSRVLAFEVERLDTRLCSEARRVATQGAPGGDVARLERDVLGKLHLSALEQLRMQLEAGSAGFRSAQWADGPSFEHAQWRPDAKAARDCERAEAAWRGRTWHAARMTAGERRGLVAADLGAVEGDLRAALQGALVLVIPLAVLVTAAGAALLAAVTVRPLNRLRDAMKRVDPQGLDQRLSSAGADREFRDLIEAYNTMLARLDASFRQASRFSADAAHELKTPLTILQGRLEQAISRSDRRSIQADLTDMLDDVGALAAITRKLLLLSQADAGHLALHRVRIELSEQLEALVSDAQMLADGITLRSRIEPGLEVEGDRALLCQVFNNLISNALRHGLPGGWVTVDAARRPGGVEVMFGNATLPIAPEARARLFDRFYRADPAHERRTEGHGLGLSLAREIARAHGGDLTLEPSAGTEVRLRLWLPDR